jgi:hypothetical protein
MRAENRRSTKNSLFSDDADDEELSSVEEIIISTFSENGIEPGYWAIPLFRFH